MAQTVGVAGGLVQGGGHGPLTNLYGFLADTALQFKVITADGVLKTANAKTNPDLFWALRGGGPAAFGVIVEATYKTFEDQPSSGLSLDIDTTHTTNATLFWQAVTIFHGYSTRFVDNGLYVYYELGTTGQNLHVHPFVGIGKTPAELQAVLKPMFDDFAKIGITYTSTSSNYGTFYDLYNAVFEPEAAGNSALTGGWTIGRQDVAENHPAIITAFQTVLGAGSFMVGHMWSAGHGLPQNQWANSAVNPRFRSVVDKLITIVPVGGNAPLADKAAAQHKLTYVVDAALRDAAPNGCTYINEVSCFGCRPGVINMSVLTIWCRPTPTSPTGNRPSSAPTTRRCSISGRSMIPTECFTPSRRLAPRTGSRSRREPGSAASSER